MAFPLPFPCVHRKCEVGGRLESIFCMWGNRVPLRPLLHFNNCPLPCRLMNKSIGFGPAAAKFRCVHIQQFKLTRYTFCLHLMRRCYPLCRFTWTLTLHCNCRYCLVDPCHLFLRCCSYVTDDDDDDDGDKPADKARC